MQQLDEKNSNNEMGPHKISTKNLTSSGNANLYFEAKTLLFSPPKTYFANISSFFAQSISPIGS
jgi:hypothetical protein